MADLLRFPSAARRDPAVAAWLASRPRVLRPLVEAWFERLRALGPDVRELMHDGCATACVDDVAFAHVGAFAAHVGIYFFHGARLPDPARLREGSGKHGRHVKLRPGAPVDAPALEALVAAAYLDARMRVLIRAIAARDPGVIARIDAAVARATCADDVLLAAIAHHAYAGDTLLHVAAIVFDAKLARALVDAGADVRAKNRRGAEPLHYACDGGPGGPTWDPPAQAAMIELLVAAGADANAVDKRGVAPLHRAARTRCTPAVRALLAAGADPERTTPAGSTARGIAAGTTGRGGSGTPEAKAEQAKILALLA